MIIGVYKMDPYVLYKLESITGSVAMVQPIWPWLQKMFSSPVSVDLLCTQSSIIDHEYFLS